jgi:hypothetical protein
MSPNLSTNIIQFVQSADNQQLSDILRHIRNRLCFLPLLPEDIVLLILDHLHMDARICLINALYIPANSGQRVCGQYWKLSKCKRMATTYCVDTATIRLVDHIKLFADYIFYKLPSILEMNALITFNWSPFKANPKCTVLVSWENVWPYARVNFDVHALRSMVVKNLRAGCTLLLLSAFTIVPHEVDDQSCTRVVFVRGRYVRIYNSQFHHMSVDLMPSTCKCGCLPRMLRNCVADRATFPGTYSF